MMSEPIEREPRHLHPTWVVYSAIQNLRTLIVPFFILIVSGGRNLFELFGLGMVLVITLVMVGARTLIWRRFTYRFDEHGIRVDSGLISRQERFLPADRIQAIDFNENLLHRLLGVVAVRIESAAGAGSGADITLEALSRAEGDRVRRTLLERGNVAAARADEAPAAGVAPIDDGELLARASFATLLLAGATSGRVGPALGVIVGALQFVDDVLPSGPEEWLTDAIPGASLRGILIAAAVCALAAWLFAIASTLLTFGNFELRRVEQRLQATYGLLERRRVSIPIARVQAVTISEGILRQPFGLAAIRAESAGYGTDTAESGVLMPIIRRRDIPAFLDSVLPAYRVDLDRLEMNGPPERALRRYVMGSMWGFVALTLLLFVAILGNARYEVIDAQIAWQWLILAIPVLAVSGLIGWLRYRDDGWLVAENGRVVIRGRPLHRVTTVTTTRRVQLRSLSANPMQRRARLVSFSAAVASGGGGGSLGIAHLDRADGDALLEMLGRPVPSGFPKPA